MLEGLSTDMKLKLIGLLSESVRKASKTVSKKSTASKFYGVWHDSRDADAIVDEIYASRNFRNRELEWT